MAFLLLLQKKFFRRFMDGRPGPWGPLAAAFFGIRTLWRWSRRDEDVAYRAVLKPGQTVTIVHTNDTEVSMKKQRKAAKNDARRANSRKARRTAARDDA